MVGSKRKDLEAEEAPEEERKVHSSAVAPADSEARGVSPPSEAATVVNDTAPTHAVAHTTQHHAVEDAAAGSTVDTLLSVVLEALRRNREQRQELMQQIVVENGVLLELLRQLGTTTTAPSSQDVDQQLVSLLIPQIMM